MILGRRSDHAVLRDHGDAHRGAARPRRPCRSGGRRDRRARYGGGRELRRRAGHDRDQRPRALAHDRDNRAPQHGRDPGDHRGLPARGTGDRNAVAHRTVRPVPRDLRRPRRLPAGGARCVRRGPRARAHVPRPDDRRALPAARAGDVGRLHRSAAADPGSAESDVASAAPAGVARQRRAGAVRAHRRTGRQCVSRSRHPRRHLPRRRDRAYAGGHADFGRRDAPAHERQALPESPRHRPRHPRLVPRAGFARGTAWAGGVGQPVRPDARVGQAQARLPGVPPRDPPPVPARRLPAVEEGPRSPRGRGPDLSGPTPPADGGSHRHGGRAAADFP